MNISWLHLVEDKNGLQQQTDLDIIAWGGPSRILVLLINLDFPLLGGSP